ncbi:MAG: hypothetical protein KJZ83_11465 [Burkholderiaceae bacterium]|nr:hypothetical protein [Burkholderiaceae bacterium]
MQTSALRHLIDLIYDSMLEPQALSKLLEHLCATYGAHSAQLISTASVNCQGFWTGHAIDPAAVQAYERYYAALSPWRAAYPSLARGASSVLRGEALVSDARLLRSEFYNDFLRPNRQRWMRAAYLRPEGALASGYGLYLYREPQAAPFEQETDQGLGALAAHLLRVERLGAAAAYWIASQGEGACASFLLTAKGRVLQCNEAGEALVDDGVVVAGARGVSFGSQQASLWLHGVLASRPGERDGAIVHRHLEQLSPEELVEFTLAPMRATACSPLTRAAALLLNVRRVVRAIDDATLARVAHERMRWTRAEVETVRRLADGERIEQIAAARECALETVRSHIKSAKRKAGASRQMDLVRLVHQLRRAGGGG